MFSNTELFPLDCEPTTAIWGRSIGFWTWGAISEGSERVGRSYTYAHGGEDILELVDESDQRRIIDVYTMNGKVSVYPPGECSRTYGALACAMLAVVGSCKGCDVDVSCRV